MCTSIVVNKKKTIVGWNLDILNMEHRVRPTPEGVFIEINDAKEGWLPLFGANSRGDFVGMPTCWPFDERSNPKGKGQNIIRNRMPCVRRTSPRSRPSLKSSRSLWRNPET